jgi:hypothetical protein
MALTEEQRARLMKSTRDAAGAFVEDMEYLREVAKREDTSRREIRHISATLRKLIVERDIEIIATPRVGRIFLTAPDNRPYHRVSEKLPFLFFMSGGANVFGGRIDRMTAFDTQVPKGMGNDKVVQALVDRLPKGDDAIATVQLNLDNFAQQRVICYRGRWIARQRIIKYLANISSGVHSGAPKDDDDKALAQIRSSSAISIGKDGGLHLDLFKNGIDSDEMTITHTPDAVDLVLVEVLAAATYLTISPMAIELEATVREELGLPAAAAHKQKE